ncbi:hypothetical protein DC28_07500 [Spirochaeta lutea]|uniref:Uncharacterized protein n=1 Tax=Spirochaeta lutea TaxID=1480694 RepID=A0A098QWG5_9SPIO|nr:hypothetical protein DC28_07500 [Spirochaeta lutea]
MKIVIHRGACHALPPKLLSSYLKTWGFPLGFIEGFPTYRTGKSYGIIPCDVYSQTWHSGQYFQGAGFRAPALSMPYPMPANGMELL